MSQNLEKDLVALEASGIITDSGKNLRSKIESISRSIENLQEKKLRIEFEIKRQKKSLVRKREELKKETSRTSAKVSLALESDSFYNLLLEDDFQQLRAIDSRLLSESSRVLEQD